jgi:hypothetical protein
VVDPSVTKTPVITHPSPGERLVASCRTAAYRQAVRSAGGVEVTLTGATAIQVQPLDADAIAAYLCRSAGGPARPAGTRS